MTILRAAGLALALLAVAALALACGDGDDNDVPTPTPAAPDSTPPGPGGTPGDQGCIDLDSLPPSDAPAPWEVGNDPVFFRFGLPPEALQSGNVCPDDLALVAIRTTGEVGDEPVVLQARNVDTGTELEFETEPVIVPGEEDLGAFFNAVVQLDEAGRWDFTVVIEGGSTTYRIPIREP